MIKPIDHSFACTAICAALAFVTAFSGAGLTIPAVLAETPKPKQNPQLKQWPAKQLAQPKQLPQLKPLQPKIGLPPPSPAPGQAKPIEDSSSYPVLGQLEVITFGHANAQLPVNERFNQLETAIYHQTYPSLSLSDRMSRLQETLLGKNVDPDERTNYAKNIFSNPGNFQMEEPGMQSSLPTAPGAGAKSIDPRLLAAWRQPFFQEVLDRDKLERFALDLVNQHRQQLGLAALQWDDLSASVARGLVDDLCARETVSHLNKNGENPDVRYTRAGGNDALSESLAAIGGAPAKKLNRELVARCIEEMKSHQDDRDSLMSADATHFAFSVAPAKSGNKALACAEVVTKHAILHPIPEALKLGERIEVKGVVLEPYKFQKLTIAWEGNSPDSLPGQAEPEVEQDEAMPYFPPLDYVAYASKAEHDREKLMAILRTTGVIAAIAGGMFMPPVALAAPLIAMAPSGGEPKAAADVKVHGGMKTQGSTFSGVVPVNHQNKSGLYYLTVWAATSDFGHLVPVSRRTIVVKPADDSDRLAPAAENPDAKPQRVSRRRSKREVIHSQSDATGDAQSRLEPPQSATSPSSL